jgi:hypothetical protein
VEGRRVRGIRAGAEGVTDIDAYSVKWRGYNTTLKDCRYLDGTVVTSSFVNAHLNSGGCVLY